MLVTGMNWPTWPCETGLASFPALTFLYGQIQSGAIPAARGRSWAPLGAAPRNETNAPRLWPSRGL